MEKKKESISSSQHKKSIDFEELKTDKYLSFISEKCQKINSVKIKKSACELIKIIKSDLIDVGELSKISFKGISDEVPSLRSLIWKILFQYLPEKKDDWDSVLEEKRLKYNTIKENIYTRHEMEKQEHSKHSNIDDILKNHSNIDQNLNHNIKKKKSIDHPLSINDNSKWKSFFSDIELIDEIDKDVRRTRTHMHFFFLPSNPGELKNLTSELISETADKKRNEYCGEHVKYKYETNADVLCRILFIYAKLYPEIRYIQGMNELLAPIYYCFSLDKNPQFSGFVEADAFLCFDLLMNRIKDVFNRKKDSIEIGINARMKNVDKLLKKIDLDLYKHFENNKVEIQYFAFRWYTLFLTQEFELPDVLRLWDSLLSVENIFEFMNFLCLAIIKIKKDEVLNKDFSGIMLAMQNLEKIRIENLIHETVIIQNDFSNKQN